MATLIPSIEKILKQKVKPEPGELHLLRFLDAQLDNSFEVYFNPFMNGDRPDIVIIKEKKGVYIIEVKDYYLNKYRLDERKNFVVKSNNVRTHKSPVSQVLKYKDNLFDLHIENLLEKRINDFKSFNMVSCGVYFHNSNSEEISNMLVNPFLKDKKYQTFLRYNIDFIGRDNLNKNYLKSLFKKRFMISNAPSIYFDENIYKSIKRFMKPTIHQIEDGEDIPYSKKQLNIIYESNKKQQRIKGVVGSGKTTVLAARAVQAHKRSKGKVLILTYNITLKNFIKDKISKVREEFSWENFIILNYHDFINIELNNIGVDIVVPENFEKYSANEKSMYFETNYYSNKTLFFNHLNELSKFDAIFIDEIQDYTRPWMEIIKECFLKTDGEYVLFGDVKQNIYDNKTESKDVSTNVRGVTELKNCFRSDFKIKDLAIQYQKDVFVNKYEIDDFNNKSLLLEFDFKRDQQGSLNYIFLPNANNITSLYTIIHQNIQLKNLAPNDVTILGNSIGMLREFDAFYRFSTNERTKTMFETEEFIYRVGFNYLGNEIPEWLNSFIEITNWKSKKEIPKALAQLCSLFSLHDLITKYPSRFEEKLKARCQKCGIDHSLFQTLLSKHKIEILDFKQKYSTEKITNNLKTIRKNKKLHFTQNSGTLKISTIHSFKGWESETVFLILDKDQGTSSFDEVLYTGITRTRANLILINYGNQKYHQKLKSLVDKVN